MSNFLFSLACGLFSVLIYLGFIPRDDSDSIALVYLAVAINAAISLLILGVLCFG